MQFLLNYLRDKQALATRAGALNVLCAPDASTRLLVMAPHPDDETLGAGGTLQMTRAAGGAARIVFVTNGDGSRSTQISLNLRTRRYHTFRGVARLRRAEAKNAARVLGVFEDDVIFLGYPDGGLRAIWENHPSPKRLYRSKTTRARRSPYISSQTLHANYCAPSLLDDVTRTLMDFQPNLILTTHPTDMHPDHAALFAVTRAALNNLRRDASTRDFAQNCRMLTYLVHHGIWPVPHGHHLGECLAPPPALCHARTHWRQLPLSEEAQCAKARALACHDSQMLFTPHYLRGFVRRNELFCELDE